MIAAPVHMMPEDPALFATNVDGNNELQDTQFQMGERTEPDEEIDDQLPQGHIGKYVEHFFTDNMAPAILEEGQHVNSGEAATLRVYVTKEF